MSKKDKFWSVAELAFTKASIGTLAIAIEMGGFYTWDRFGRYCHISSKGGTNDWGKIYNNVLDKLAEGHVGDEEDSDYYYRMMVEQTVLSMSGWTESKLPDFEKIQAEWNKKYVGITEIPKHHEPASQSKVWNVVEGLIKLHFKDEGIIDDLKGEHSMKANDVCKQLELVGVNITSKTLKTYLKNSK